MIISFVILILPFVTLNVFCVQEAEFSSNFNGMTCLLESLGYSPAFLDSAVASCFGEISTPLMTMSNQNNTIDQLANNFSSFSTGLLSKLDTIIDSVKNLIEFSRTLSNQISSNEQTVNSEARKLSDFYPRDCRQLKEIDDKKSDLKTIYIESNKNFPVTVQCDQNTDGGGWTIIQSRMDLNPRETFQRTWIEYVLGFGNITGEYWFGLEKIHLLTKNYLMELRFDLEDYEGEKRYANYDYFHVGNEATSYTLTVGGYAGTAGDSFSGQNNNKFTTKDKDNDVWENNCADKFKGGFWFSDCHSANINGYQYKGKHDSYMDGIIWRSFKGYHYSLKTTQMKIRPAFPNYRL